MSNIVKTVSVAQLPESWRRELGAGSDALVRVELVEMEAKRSEVEVGRLLALLNSVTPVSIEGDVTSFVRFERDRLDERSGAGRSTK